MRVKDTEIQKINSNDIKEMEKVLHAIDEQENGLLDDFDKHIDIILGEITKDVFEEVKKLPNYGSGDTFRVSVNNNEYLIPKHFLFKFHKSYISNQELRHAYEEKLTSWFTSKTNLIKSALNAENTINSVMPPSFALSSLAITSFYKKPNTILSDTQKMAAIAMNDGNIAEVGDINEKNLSIILPAFLHSLKGNGIHIINSSNYLSRRDYQETLPVYNGLGLSSGYLYDDITKFAEIEEKNVDSIGYAERNELEGKLKKSKQKSYECDITYGSSNAFATDYLSDSLATNKEDIVQKNSIPEFAIIDGIDEVLIDNAQSPYKIDTKIMKYTPNMSLKTLCAEQMILFQDVSPKITEYKINQDNLSYEEARLISNEFGKRKIMANNEKYYEAAKKFLSFQKILKVEDEKYGFNTGIELFNAIVDDDKYNSDYLRKNNSIIYSEELKDFVVSDKCYEDFLKYCYFTIEINSLTIKYQEQIKNDKNYLLNSDYNVLPNGRISLTMMGANKVLNDNNYNDFINDYYEYLKMDPIKMSSLYQILNNTITNNLITKKDEGYTIENEIEEDNYLTTITQKDFYDRYKLYSGITTTSLKKVFDEVYNKKTIEIPKQSYYGYFSERKTLDKEPNMLVNGKINFTSNKDEKVELIIKSINDSINSETKQPVLVVVSNDDEINLLDEKLKVNNVKHNILLVDMSDEDKALAIAKSGSPGMVTLSSDISFDSSDIKLGGNRDTIIDIATDRHIKSLEKKENTLLNYSQFEREELKEKVEKALMNSQKINLWSEEIEKENHNKLETVGLKVILSGPLKTNRMEKRVDGIIDDSNMFGVIERYACTDDLKAIGLLSINETDSSSLKSKIEEVQQKNEEIEKKIVESSQRINSPSNKIIKYYRDERRTILDDSVNMDEMYNNMIEKVSDEIVSSNIMKRELDKNDLSKSVNDINLKVDVEAINLESKQNLGVTFDSRLVSNSRMSLTTLKDSIINTAKERKNKMNVNAKDALLSQNDYLVLMVPLCLEHIYFINKPKTLLVAENNELSKEKIDEIKEKLVIDSYKAGCQQSIGISLSKGEFKELEMKKRELHDMIPFRSNVVKNNKLNQTTNNNLSLLDKFKKIKEKLQNKNKQENKEIETPTNTNNNPLNNYSNIKVKPLKLMDTLSDGKEIKSAVLSQNYNNIGTQENNRALKLNFIKKD